MAEPTATVAILVATPALSSILAATLAADTRLRVRAFENETALLTYLRLAPVNVVVADFDAVEARADLLADKLRHIGVAPQNGVRLIALASAMTPEVRIASARAGIDEVIMKPMSPRYLLERVTHRLPSQGNHGAMRGPGRSTSLRPVPRDWSRFGDNVVPLFKVQAEPRP